MRVRVLVLGRARADRWTAVGPRLDIPAHGEDQALGGGGDLGDGGLEGLGVAGRRLPEAAHLAHVLARGGVDLAGRRGIVLVAEGSDASAHAGSVQPIARSSLGTFSVRACIGGAQAPVLGTAGPASCNVRVIPHARGLAIIVSRRNGATLIDTNPGRWARQRGPDHHRSAAGLL